MTSSKTSNNGFTFKQFRIKQGQCAMKVTTDACILGALTNPANNDQILDIGAGTGLLSLMLAQRTEGKITAIELDQEAADQAKENISNSPWAEQIKVHTSSIQDYAQNTGQQFDCIISNPPFFDSALKCPDQQRNMARHTDSLGFDDLAAAISHLLSENGKSWVLLPVVSSQQFLECARAQQLYPQEIIALQSTTRRAPHRHILVLGKTEQKVVHRDLCIYGSQGGYSEAPQRTGRAPVYE